MRHRLMLGLMFLAIATTPILAGEDTPTTQPVPATQPLVESATIRKWVVQLADDNYTVRESSRIALMGLQRKQLPDLRDAVKRCLPLEPSQTTVLRDIVTQIYLSGDLYPGDESAAGFLGIGLPNRNRDEGLLYLERGIAVVSRVPGFSAYRMLQTGDVILAMTSPHTVEFKSSDPMESFRDAVKAIPAGQNVTFEVLRQGRIISVPVTLARRPLGIDNPNFLEEFMPPREQRAEDYWDKDFAPMLSDSLG